MNPRNRLPWLVAALAAFCTCAVLADLPELPPGFRIGSDGGLALDEVTMHIQHFAPGLRSAAQRRRAVSGTPVVERDSWHLDGRFAVGDKHSFALAETITRIGPNAIAYAAELGSPEPVPTQQLALAVNLPIHIFTGVPLKIGGETFVLPEAPFSKTLRWRGLKRLECPTPRGRLVMEGVLGVQLQDGRNFTDKRHFRLRLLFSPEAGELRSSSLALSLRVEPYAKGEKRPAFGAGRDFELAANDEWRPLEHHVFTREGSVLDWSAMNDGPAGQHGRVVVRDGHFEFENQPGRRVRFYGINVCDRANYLRKPDCEALAAQLSRLGYNAVRLHHYDRHLVRPGCTLEAGWDSQQLDRFEYLFCCLKRAGLYVTIDLYTVRKVIAGEIKEVNRDVSLNEFKALVAISPSARANWTEFARRLLTHVNPYTGLAWKDDPALFGICLLNEDDTTAVWDSAADIAALYQKRFAEWQRDRGAAGRSREQEWARFLIETHLAMTRQCSAFLRELGVRALLTDANFRQNVPLGLIRGELDYVDNHGYHDLRKFLSAPFQLPYGFQQRSAVSGLAETPGNLFGARLFGKPYTVTEFNYCYPNRFRAEGGPLMGAYAALQDWDGLFRYAYSHTPERATTVQPIVHLDNAADPINLLADRIAVLLFRRGDVRAAPSRAEFPVSEACLDVPQPLERPQGFVPPEFEMQGLISRVGSVLAVRPAQTAALAVAETKRLVSETGEIVLESGSGRMRVVTERTECFVVAGPDTVRGKAVEICNHGGPAVVCVSAMDDQPLAASHRLLVIHLTDVQNTGVRFRDAGWTTLSDWGRLPHLVRRGSVDIRVHGAGQDLPGVRAIQLDGTPAHAMAVHRDGDAWQFTAATVQPQGTFLVYEASSAGQR